MIKPLVCLLLWVATSCASSTRSTGASAAPDPAGHEHYTHIDQLEIHGEVVGYLMQYDPVPLHAEVKRTFPTGTRRILDRRWKDVGYVSPSGTVCRYARNGDREHLGSHDLEEGLSFFFDQKGPVARRMMTLPRPATPRTPAAVPEAAVETEDRAAMDEESASDG